MEIILVWLAGIYVLLGIINFILVRVFLWKQEQNIFTVLYVILSPLTIGYSISEILGDLATERHKLKIMTVYKDGHIITFENFEQYEMFAGYIVRRMFEDGEIEGTAIEMERLQDYDLWVKYISELEDSNDIILTEFGNCTVCRVLTYLEKEKIKSENESEK